MKPFIALALLGLLSSVANATPPAAVAPPSFSPASPMDVQTLYVLPVGPRAPVVHPQKPDLYWSWNRIPTAFQGSKKERAFNDAEVQRLAKYQMLTLEKWYTPCASQGPTQSGPSCDVEDKMLQLYALTKAISPEQITIFYWNTMFDFAFYRAHAQMLAMEAAGLPSFLRDEHGEIISMCNDGNVYCNITTFDWTQPHVRELWVGTVVNMTQTGLVDGIFADHSSNIGITIGPNKNKHQGPNQLCNGKGAQEQCYNFTDEFKASFNSWHLWSTNYTQDLLAKSTGGAVFQGPYAEAEFRAAGDVCDFDAMREFALHGKSKSDVFIIQSPRARPITMEACQPTEKCLAAFLAAAKPYMYIYCQWDKGEDLLNETTFPEMDYLLGEPESDAVEVDPGVWRRRFGGGGNGTTHNMTVVFWDNKKKTGNISWAGHPPPTPTPTPPPPPPPPGAVCNPATFLNNTAYADGTGLAEVEAVSAVACCTKCAAAEASSGCFWFSFDQATGKCFLKADDRNPQARTGVTSGLTHH